MKLLFSVVVFCRGLMAVKVCVCFCVFFSFSFSFSFMSVGKFVMIKVSYCVFLCGEVATVKTSSFLWPGVNWSLANCLLFFVGNWSL